MKQMSYLRQTERFCLNQAASIVLNLMTLKVKKKMKMKNKRMMQKITKLLTLILRSV
jgi:preprotein translocase subunit SecY